MFYSLQGEGAQAGRPAIFCRFTGCNLWTGKEKHRKQAICNFCDTDFLGTDGHNGGQFASEQELVSKVLSLWPNDSSPAYIIFTGGEPGLQLTQALVDEFKKHDVVLAIETNGTVLLPDNLDWICLSPKGKSDVILTQCDELKLVFPQEEAMPERFAHIKANFRYLSPKNPFDQDNIIVGKNPFTAQSIQYCLDNPSWRLCLQTHKILGIE